MRIAKTVDTLLQLKDAGALTASAASQVGGSNRVLDFGAKNIDGGYINGDLLIDVTAIDTTSGDEKYEIEVQVSDDSTFAAGVFVKAEIKLGDSTTSFSTADNVAGRIVQSVSNEFQGVVYRYMRLFNRIAGTTPSINYTAWFVKQQPTA